MKLSIQIDTAALRQQMEAIGGQAAFAASKALNATARRLQEAIPAGLEAQLDRPTRFTTTNSTFLRAATKRNLTAAVLFKDRQAAYLRYQVEGGTRQPKNRALRLPAAIKLNEFGNLPRNAIAQLLAVAKREGKLGKRTARRIQVSSRVEIFYGDPTEAGLPGAPAGIYKRVTLSGGRGQLVPLIVFPETAARYRPILDLQRIALPVVRDHFAREFRIAAEQALRTAR